MLEIVDLHAAYGNIRVLDGVSLRVRTGETVAIIGSNGAGKSTMLRTISGLMRAREGPSRTKASTSRMPRRTGSWRSASPTAPRVAVSSVG